MKTTLRHCFLANFAVRPAALTRLLPPHLTPDIHGGSAFVSVVVAEMSGMRPAFLPRALGVTYSQVVYRAVVRCGSERGVTFLRTDADNALMVAAGDALTFFRFNRAKIAWDRSVDRVGFLLTPTQGDAAHIRADYDIAGATNQLPPASAFSDLSAAQAFLTELYAGFGARRPDGRVEVVRIRRSPWSGVVVRDQLAVYEAMTSGLLFESAESVLDSVYYVKDVDYHWSPLTLERPFG